MSFDDIVLTSMATHPHRKQYLIAAVIFGLLILINVVGFWFFLRPGISNTTFAGTVSELSDNTITIVDGKGRPRIFTLATTTKIVTGKDVTSGTSLSIDTFVMISTNTDEGDAIATKIRIMSTDPFGRPHKPEKI